MINNSNFLVLDVNDLRFARWLCSLGRTFTDSQVLAGFQADLHRAGSGETKQLVKCSWLSQTVGYHSSCWYMKEIPNSSAQSIFSYGHHYNPLCLIVR